MRRVIPARALQEGQRIVKRDSRGTIRSVIPVHDVDPTPAKCGRRGTHVNFGEICYGAMAVVEVK